MQHNALNPADVKIEAPDRNYCYGSRFVFDQRAARFYGYLDMKTSKMNYWCKITKLVRSGWAHSTITRSINRGWKLDYSSSAVTLACGGRVVRLAPGCISTDAIGELGRNRCIKTASGKRAPRSSNWNSFGLHLPSKTWMATFDELSDPAICYQVIIRWLYTLSLVSLRYYFTKLGFCCTAPGISTPVHRELTNLTFRGEIAPLLDLPISFIVANAPSPKKLLINKSR
jgi:hypothetical protein